MLEEFRRGGPFQLALLRYTQALLTQISQTAVCNRLHPVDKRLCRWLLLTRDRLPSDEILMTQEFIAHMLGVRREGVTAAAHHLQGAGLIRYRSRIQRDHDRALAALEALRQRPPVPALAAVPSEPDARPRAAAKPMPHEPERPLNRHERRALAAHERQARRRAA